MGTIRNEYKIGRRALGLLSLQWISDTGRLVLRCISFGKINFPKTEMAGYKTELEHSTGFGGRLWITVRRFVIDSVYFPIGLVFWMAMIFLVVYTVAKFIGPMPSIHEWR
jgi:hypothetical protein